MIPSILLFGFLAGLDNLQVCSSIGLAPISRARIRTMATMFCLCETAGPLVGVLLGKPLLHFAGAWAHTAGPLVMIVCAISIFRAALRRRDEAVSGFAAPALPLSLCLDNVVVGAALSPLAAVPIWLAALCIGVTSASMSCAGLYGARRTRRLLAGMPRFSVETIGSAYLVVLAVRMLTERPA